MICKTGKPAYRYMKLFLNKHKQFAVDKRQHYKTKSQRAPKTNSLRLEQRLFLQIKPFISIQSVWAMRSLISYSTIGRGAGQMRKRECGVTIVRGTIWDRWFYFRVTKYFISKIIIGVAMTKEEGVLIIPIL